MLGALIVLIGVLAIKPSIVIAITPSSVLSDVDTTATREAEYIATHASTAYAIATEIMGTLNAP